MTIAGYRSRASVEWAAQPSKLRLRVWQSFGLILHSRFRVYRGSRRWLRGWAPFLRNLGNQSTGGGVNSGVSKMVLWVFGYGSLIWKPSFSFEERVVGYVKNYRRVFHQACIDFRGTQQRPGRTLTLEEQEGAETWGVAYRVTASVEAQLVEAYLNQRERTYDVRASFDVYTAASPHTPAVCDALTYIATPSSSNLCYLGPAPLQVMAEQIARSRGPAGENHEYLFLLEESLRQIGAACVDQEIVELANEVRKILRSDNEVPKILIRQALQNRHRDLGGIVGSGDDSLRRRIRIVSDEDAMAPMRMAWGPHYSGAPQVIAS